MSDKAASAAAQGRFAVLCGAISSASVSPVAIPAMRRKPAGIEAGNLAVHVGHDGDGEKNAEDAEGGC